MGLLKFKGLQAHRSMSNRIIQQKVEANYQKQPTKIGHHKCKVNYEITRCSAIAERPRCRVRYSFR